MKRILIAILFLGCGPTIDLTTEGYVISYGVDFRPYSEQGFLFTPEPPVSNYESIGQIYITLTPKVIETTKTIWDQFKDSNYKIGEKKYRLEKLLNGGEVKYYGFEILELDTAIEALYSRATSWGANAVYNFTVDTSEEDIITVSGFAVKQSLK